MKRILIVLTAGLLLFGLGWWTNDMRKFANGVIADGQQLDTLRNNHTLFLDSLKSKK